ncbi:MAG: hypothetical protein H7138_07340 [Myxococcales bacterium]|nr:hypothetical protein [Myxococcales bacterium]
MPAPRPPRRRSPERGNSLLIALIVLSSLATLGSLTVVSVQSSLRASTNDRSHAIAMYAAESGGAAAMAFLREPANFDAANGWSAYVTQNGEPTELTALVSHNKPPGDLDNELSPDQNAYFFIELINNRSDPNYVQPPGGVGPANDKDGIVIIRSTGHGPQGSTAVIEWEVQRIPPDPLPPPDPALPPPPPPDPTAAIRLPPLPPWIVPPATKGLHIRSWHILF